MQQRLKNGSLTARKKKSSVLLQRSPRFVKMYEVAAVWKVCFLQYLGCNILAVIFKFPEEYNILVF